MSRRRPMDLSAELRKVEAIRAAAEREGQLRRETMGAAERERQLASLPPDSRYAKVLQILDAADREAQQHREAIAAAERARQLAPLAEDIARMKAVASNIKKVFARLGLEVLLETAPSPDAEGSRVEALRANNIYSLGMTYRQLSDRIDLCTRHYDACMNLSGGVLSPMEVQTDLATAARIEFKEGDIRVACAEAVAISRQRDVPRLAGAAFRLFDTFRVDTLSRPRQLDYLQSLVTEPFNAHVRGVRGIGSRIDDDHEESASGSMPPSASA